MKQGMKPLCKIFCLFIVAFFLSMPQVVLAKGKDQAVCKNPGSAQKQQKKEAAASKGDHKKGESKKNTSKKNEHKKKQAKDDRALGGKQAR